MDILKLFRMLDCKAIATPMESNLKLLCDASSESIDATMYRQMIGSLMYLTNTRPYICFAVKTLSQFLTEPRHVHLIATKSRLFSDVISLGKARRLSLDVISAVDYPWV